MPNDFFRLRLLVGELFSILEIEESTDDGRPFHPNTIRSCRAQDAERIEKLIKEIKSILCVKR